MQLMWNVNFSNQLEPALGVLSELHYYSVDVLRCDEMRRLDRVRDCEYS
jgi:hypothetical protein